MKITKDNSIRIAVGNSRTSTNWRNIETTFEQLKRQLADPVRTKETVAEYKRMTPADKSRVKDVGGVVCGWLEGGRRLKNAVI